MFSCESSEIGIKFDPNDINLQNYITWFEDSSYLKPICFVQKYTSKSKSININQQNYFGEKESFKIKNDSNNVQELQIET